jgi:hypothetical protein
MSEQVFGKATIAIDGHVQNSGVPNKIINEAKKLDLSLYEFSYIDDDGDFYTAVNVDEADGCRFGCGCFEFIKSTILP